MRRKGVNALPLIWIFGTRSTPNYSLRISSGASQKTNLISTAKHRKVWTKNRYFDLAYSYSKCFQSRAILDTCWDGAATTGQRTSIADGCIFVLFIASHIYDTFRRSRRRKESKVWRSLYRKSKSNKSIEDTRIVRLPYYATKPAFHIRGISEYNKINHEQKNWRIHRGRIGPSWLNTAFDKERSVGMPLNGSRILHARTNRSS